MIHNVVDVVLKEQCSVLRHSPMCHSSNLGPARRIDNLATWKPIITALSFFCPLFWVRNFAVFGVLIAIIFAIGRRLTPTNSASVGEDNIELARKLFITTSSLEVSKRVVKVFNNLALGLRAGFVSTIFGWESHEAIARKPYTDRYCILSSRIGLLVLRHLTLRQTWMGIRHIENQNRTEICCSGFHFHNQPWNFVGSPWVCQAYPTWSYRPNFCNLLLDYVNITCSCMSLHASLTKAHIVADI